MAATTPNKIPRKDSLYARLGSEEKRTQVFAWLIVDCVGPEKVAEQIQDNFGITTSAAAVCEMQRRWGLSWRIAYAEDAANDETNKLPKDLDKKAKQRLREQYYDSIFEGLSKSEILSFAQFDLSERQFQANVAKTETELKQKAKALKQKDTQLKQKDRQIAQSERRVKLLEANANAAKALLEKAKSSAGKGMTQQTLKDMEEALKLL